MSSMSFAIASHQFVFKIKREWPNERAETRRYGFTGHLAQKQVFDGLYDRASQVFGLARESFFLAYAGNGSTHSGAERRLDDYDAFLAHVCREILSPEGLASAPRDAKGRIVLVFHARRHRDPQPEPAAATFSQWDEDTALALAQSSELKHEHAAAAAAAAEHCPLDAAEQGQAPSSLEWAPIPVTQATRMPTPAKYPSLADTPVTANYQWSWAGPTFPPPPPSTLLSDIKHRAAVAPPVVPAQASTGYTPSYSAPAPAAGEPEPEPEQPEPSLPVVEAWSGVKNLLRTFVHDLNLHLAANFDEAAGFELRLPESDASVPAAKDVPAETEHVKDEVHPSVFCDHCLKTIVGTRFKCTDAACPNWDCCQVCVGTFSSFHDGSHVLGAIAKPGATLIKQERTTVEAVAPAPAAVQETLPVLVEHPATCNACDHTIKGIRHKCLNCPDHDLCSSCFLRVSSIHPHHNFLPITDPSSVRIKVQPGERVVHRNIVCDGCEASPIVGVRYLCTHDSCGGQFDLCANCEADPIPRHPRSHHLLKIREPVAHSSVIPAVQLARAKTASPLDGILRSLGISPESNETTGFASNAQFVEGPGNDRTLVIDLDLDPAMTGLPSVIHVPIAIPAGGLESVVTEPVVAEPVVVEAVVAEPYETYDTVELETEERDCQQGSLEVEDLPAALPALAATFVKDVTLVDRSSVAPGALFTKIWQVENTGTQAWPVGTHLVHVGGCLSSSTEDLATKSVPLAVASEVVEISCDLKAPEDDGRKMYLFRLADANGEHFGDRIWVDITVESDEDALRQSGDSLSSSIIVPSPASEAPSHVSADARSIDESDESSDEESEEDDVESIEISDDSDDSEPSDEESDGEFVILSGSEAGLDVDSELSDGEWEA